MSRLRSGLFAVSPPLRRFADGYFRRLVLVAAVVVAGGVLVAQAAFLYYFVPITHTAVPPDRRRSCRSRAARPARLVRDRAPADPRPARHYLRRRRATGGGAAGAARDLPPRPGAAVPARDRARRVWAVDSPRRGRLVARYRLGFEFDDAVIIIDGDAGASSVAGAIYQSLWHRDDDAAAARPPHPAPPPAGARHRARRCRCAASSCCRSAASSCSRAAWRCSGASSSTRTWSPSSPSNARPTSASPGSAPRCRRDGRARPHRRRATSDEVRGGRSRDRSTSRAARPEAASAVLYYVATEPARRGVRGRRRADGRARAALVRRAPSSSCAAPGDAAIGSTPSSLGGCAAACS